MFKGPIKPLSTFIVSLALVTTTGFASADYPIAGTAPFQRPEGAPKIEDVAHDPHRARLRHPFRPPRRHRAPPVAVAGATPRGPAAVVLRVAQGRGEPPLSPGVRARS